MSAIEETLIFDSIRTDAREVAEQMNVLAPISELLPPVPTNTLNLYDDSTECQIDQNAARIEGQRLRQ